MVILSELRSSLRPVKQIPLGPTNERSYLGKSSKLYLTEIDQINSNLKSDKDNLFDEFSRKKQVIKSRIRE